MNRIISLEEGWLTVIVGSMFSGKTTELFGLLSQYQYHGKEILLFKPAIDTRSKTNKAETHNGLQWNAIEISEKDPLIILDEVERKAGGAAENWVIAIDEAQFFTNDLVKVVKELRKKGYIVAVDGLNQNFMGEPFGPMPYLLALASDPIIVYGVCDKCKKVVATRTQRVDENGNALTSGEEVVIGGTEEEKGEGLYQARCERCYVRD